MRVDCSEKLPTSFPEKLPVSYFDFVIRISSRGSIVVDFELIFSNKVDGPLEPLLKVERTGKLGNMTFEMNGKSKLYMKFIISIICSVDLHSLLYSQLCRPPELKLKTDQ